MGAWIEIFGSTSLYKSCIVAPFMGAWIEIISIELCVNSDSDVAPFMGAWIEIIKASILQLWISVAPFMGAWIEIEIDLGKSGLYK